MPKRTADRRRAARKTPPTVETGEADDINLRQSLPPQSDPSSYQSSHGTTGYGDDDEHADQEDAKVKGQGRG